MSLTYEALVQELGARTDGAFLATTTGAGSATSLIASGMLARYPVSIAAQMNAWVYGSSGADTANKTYERRSSSWDNSSSGGTLTLYAPGMPGTIGNAKTYEIHPRIERARKAAAINAAVGQLGLIYWREFVDTSITTVTPTDGATVGTNGWQYNLTTLLSSLPIIRIKAIEIQKSTSTLLVSAGFPYTDARAWNYEVYKRVSSAGLEEWILQFGMLPPPGRILRIKGEAYATQLALDTDVLPLSGNWEGAAREWIYDYAQYTLNASTAAKLSQIDAQRARQAEFDRLQTAKEKLLLAAPTHEQIQVVVPGRGDGLYNYAFDSNPSWLGAFRSLH